MRVSIPCTLLIMSRYLERDRTYWIVNDSKRRQTNVEIVQKLFPESFSDLNNRIKCVLGPCWILREVWNYSCIMVLRTTSQPCLKLGQFRTSSNNNKEHA